MRWLHALAETADPEKYTVIRTPFCQVKKLILNLFLDVIIFNVCNASPRTGALWELDILFGRENVTRRKQIKVTAC